MKRPWKGWHQGPPTTIWRSHRNLNISQVFFWSVGKQNVHFRLRLPRIQKNITAPVKPCWQHEGCLSKVLKRLEKPKTHQTLAIVHHNVQKADHIFGSQHSIQFLSALCTVGEWGTASEATRGQLILYWNVTIKSELKLCICYKCNACVYCSCSSWTSEQEMRGQKFSWEE